MIEPFRLCLLGLPKTGKTTYLAALWAFLRCPQPGKKYRVTELPADTAYLDEIAAAWAAGETMPRSGPEVADHIEFTIEVPDAPPITVVLPDLPGEVFLNAIRRPVIAETPANAVIESDLLLLFVNCRSASMFEPLGDHPADPDAAPEPPPEANEGLPVAGDLPHENGGEPEEPEAGPIHDETALPDTERGATSEGGPTMKFKEFNPGDLHTDTLNTELLTRLDELLGDSGFPPLLVVVSAWDIHAEDTSLTPDDWLRDYQPMLWQHLQELCRTMTVGVVGASAQGADYGDQPDIVEAPIAVRAWGCDPNGERTDIVGPLLWYHGLPGG